MTRPDEDDTEHQVARMEGEGGWLRKHRLHLPYTKIRPRIISVRESNYEREDDAKFLEFQISRLIWEGGIP